MTRVLVTGAAGLIGRAVVPGLLERGWSVHTTSRGGAATAEHHPADLTDVAAAVGVVAAARPTHVLHLAGGTSRDPVELYRKNVTSTTTLLAAIAETQAAVRRLVVVGSAAVYGDGAGRPLVESAGLAPVSDYGRVKLAQEQAVQVLRPRASSTTTVRLFNVVSPDLPPTSPLGNLRRQLLDPAPGRGDAPRAVQCGRLDVERDFVPVDFVVDALAVLLDHDDAPRVLNLCSGRATALSDLFAEVVRQSGRPAALVTDPALGDLPAAPHVVGDATLLREVLGLRASADLADLAAVLLLDGRRRADVQSQEARAPW